MKFIKLFALGLCAATLLVSGCKSSSGGSSAKSDCGMACCKDAKMDCAHCPKCSKK